VTKFGNDSGFGQRQGKCRAHMQFYPTPAAFNLLWREEGCDGIESFIAPRGFLTRPGMPNFAGDHAETYEGFPPVGPD
jgi:hypothetical protein